ncbi:bifunctional 3'-5' exonuclease/DNA polymerase [Agromyces agglutinans]|uniref:bifunctional 3'-5' exonuclease/DNA polymerase n=1 Tax=Agromyces agglutinans TaxID=2662258 RepID=UPI001C12B8DC|nr:bifunctional 3'-5' exonuclease/DNA polymerase [Agromyces agglutinans]
MRIVLGAAGAGRVAVVPVPDAPVPAGEQTVIEPLAVVPFAELPRVVRELESSRPRWVWDDTRVRYPQLVAVGVIVERVHDLRLVGAILEHSTLTEAARSGLPARPAWLAPGPAENAVGASASPAGVLPDAPGHAGAGGAPTLFDLVPPADASTDGPERPDVRDRRERSAGAGAVHADVALDDPVRATAGAGRAALAPVAEVLAELARQDALVAESAAPAKLRLLAAAESAGALIGVEMQAAGLPWSVDVHERVLEAELGPRPSPGAKPARMAAIAAEVRAALEAPALNLDSQVDLLRALRNAGLDVASTGKWELQELEHPAIPPLLAYKKLARLLSANGWAWLEEWVADGRFRAEYVPGGTATGRWATSGGGALQLPKQVRRAVVADPGWCLVVADAAQLDPRVLAGLSGDAAMAAAGRGRDLYSGLVESGVVADRAQAKVAILGAMYGATSGDSGRLVPRLARAYPRAMALVDRAAADGERGRRVTTLLGRSSPLPPATWWQGQARAADPEATGVDERRARSSAREWGRFTRNFVVQGSSAEWALCWMAALRARLAALGAQAPAERPAAASGVAFARMPHLVYFLHDELIVHTPAEHAERVAQAVRETAVEAGRLLFGGFPVEFPLGLRVVGSYADVE